MNDQKKIQVLQDVIRIPSVNGKEAECLIVQDEITWL